MARQLNKLKQKQIENARKPGMMNDGGGLYFRVTPTGTKNWVFRFSRAGKLQDMGLGALQDVSMAQARDKAADCRQLVKDGIDPRQHRNALKQQRILADASTVTFGECARQCIESMKPGWSNPKHAGQWQSTIDQYCKPINPLPVQSVDTALVMRCLEPIWNKKAETATRVRSRIEAVLGWASARSYRTGDNPARWRNHLDKLLPRNSKTKRVKHHRALPYSKVYEFMQDLRKEEGRAARCAELTILCAGRTTETIAARLPEFDLDKAQWDIPKDRMKAKLPHRVPLSPRALEIIKEAVRDAQKDGSEFLFPGPKKGRHLSNGAMLAMLDRMEWRDRTTIHGFRSSFRDWCAEQTAAPYEVAEMALAHKVGDSTQQAYLRADLYEKRKALMRDWEKFINTPPAKGNVVKIRKAS